MRIKFKPSLLYGLIAVILILGAGFAIADKPEGNISKQRSAVDVQVAGVTRMAMPSTIYSVGRLVAIKSAEISSEVEGRIVKIFFENGDFVNQGQPIIQLDDQQAEANLFSAQATYKLSQATYNRYSTLIKEGGVSQQDVDQEKTNLESNEANVQTSRVALQQKTIFAPFSGYLGVFSVTQGAYITAGQDLVSLVDKQQLQVQYTIPQKFLSRLRLGQTISINSDSYPKLVFKGGVSFISPSINEDTGSVIVQATIDNSQNLLSPGMFVTINQIIQENADALVVPEQAIVASLQGSYVYMVKNGRAKTVKVIVGEHRNGYAQILKGLRLGENVIIAGQQKLDEGSQVRILRSPVAKSFISPIRFSDNSVILSAPTIFVGANT